MAGKNIFPLATVLGLFLSTASMAAKIEIEEDENGKLSSQLSAPVVTAGGEAQGSEETHVDLLARLQALEEEVASLKAQNSQLREDKKYLKFQIKQWKPVPVCRETHGFFGGQYYETEEVNDQGHTKVVGANNQMGWWDAEPARDGKPRGIYTVESNGVRFYIRGNCNLYSQEGPGALNDKWIGGPLHKTDKYKNLSNLSSERHAMNILKKLF